MTKVYRQQKLADNNEGLLITKDNRQQRIADIYFLKDNKSLMITKNEGLMVTKNNRQQRLADRYKKGLQRLDN